MINEGDQRSARGNRPFDINQAISQIRKRDGEIAPDDRPHYDQRVTVWTVFEVALDKEVAEGRIDPDEARRLRAKDRAQRELNARRDPLLHILTKPAMREQLSDDLQNPRGLTLALLDLDHFGAVNNTYGHNVGDEVLAEMASYYLEHLPPRSHIGRWGGEEFIVYFNETTVDEVYPIMQDLNDYLPAALAGTCRRNGITRDITMSAGITQRKKGDSVFSIVERADEIMYRAKHAGRNRVFHDQMRFQ